ncbi:Hint domain-containing protein [Pseudoroseicyclus tamaricis]|uniref:Hint domain-containing protein n=1 Tax=Pseudoroseicyclus tamaricis TaxID=2705421 RepID=A0A6B2JZR8_9RHOB|nr:Hint domain-containing protein [Pseudoroseicyclus tamaricis]NDU99615.1 Hint domain-containing protein [Pseudoroseicyclus tamaricis]
MRQRHGGLYVISFSRIRVEGHDAPPPEALRPGQSLTWEGRALRVDGPADILPLGEPQGAAGLRRRAARALRRGEPEVGPEEVEEEIPAHSLMLTDGRGSWFCDIIAGAPGRPPLLLFAGAVPPAGRELWIVRAQVSAARGARAGGVVCFTPGTMIATEAGPRPVEALEEGARVLTKDNGPQPVLWLGRRRLSGARLAAMPWLAPVRLRPGALGDGVPDAGLTVSPDHRLLLRGPRAEALFGEAEVLAAAADLVDDRLILRDRGCRDVSYVHLLLPAHEIVFANGVETESFHPAMADAESVGDGLPGMAECLPPVAGYGPYARRILSASETAILSHS